MGPFHKKVVPYWRYEFVHRWVESLKTEELPGFIALYWPYIPPAEIASRIFLNNQTCR